MYTEKPRGTREFISDNGVKMKIEYLCMQKEVTDKTQNCKNIYGIELKKYIINDDNILLDDSIRIDNLTESYQLFNYYMGKIVSGLVTPDTLIYVLDDLLAQTPYTA